MRKAGEVVGRCVGPVQSSLRQPQAIPQLLASVSLSGKAGIGADVSQGLKAFDTGLCSVGSWEP